MKLLRSKAFMQLSPHDDIQLFVELTTSVMLHSAREFALVVGYPPGLEFGEINARAHETSQRALNEGGADRMTWALLSICALIDGAEHLQTLSSPLQLQLRDAVDSAEYAYGLMVAELGFSAQLPEVYFDGLARIACSQEHTIAERRALAAEAESAFVRTSCEMLAELLSAPDSSSPLDVEGFEYDWLGVDEHGCVALFSTAGAGYAPEQFRRDTAAHCDAIQALLASNPTTDAVLFPELPSTFPNTWRDVAQRGLYAYESTPEGGPYTLVAVPSIPRRIDALPAGIGAASIRCGFRFVNTRQVTEAMLRG